MGLPRRRAAAARLDARLRKTLFVNVEPSLLDVDMPPALTALFEHAATELDVVVELTERALTDKPAEMLARVETMREPRTARWPWTTSAPITARSR